MLERIYCFVCVLHGGYSAGPGEYECKESLGRGKPGLIYSKDKRFKNDRNKIQGPGTYTVIILHFTSMLKKNFNIMKH